jgi:3-phenylpropionate/trans-cinnamate dioxygenase ferredoxin component
VTAVTEPYVEVCRLGDLPEDKAVQYVVGGDYLAVVRTQGEVFAISDYCSHADVSLSAGDVEDCHLECWMHGSRFDLRTGRPDSPPAVRPVPVHDVVVDGEGPDARVLINPHPREEKPDVQS